jgi:hypothetical protein
LGRLENEKKECDLFLQKSSPYQHNEKLKKETSFDEKKVKT